MYVICKHIYHIGIYLDRRCEMVESDVARHVLEVIDTVGANHATGAHRRRDHCQIPVCVCVCVCVFVCVCV